MSFFPRVAREDPGNELALKLFTRLKEKRVITRKVMPMYWAQVFRVMVRKHGKPKVVETLNWYMEHLGQEFVPRVSTAEMFSQKFLQIQRVMAISETGYTEAPDLRSSHLADYLENNFPYPPEVVSQLPYLVQRTRTNWSAFLTDIQTLHPWDLPEPQQRNHEFLIWVREGVQSFVTEWFVLISHRLGRLEHYTYPVPTLAWRLDNPHFRDSFWHHWSLNWCQKSNAFDKLLEWLIQRSEEKGKKS